jgi:hypothetical protein
LSDGTCDDCVTGTRKTVPIRRQKCKIAADRRVSCRTMGHMPRTASTGSERLPLRRRFAGIIDEDGEPTVGWEVDTRGEWAEKWPACPDGHPLKLRHALGFWERSVRELELRVSLGDDGWGVCQIIVDEREDEVYVRVLLHRSDDCRGLSLTAREYLDWPVRVSLVRPLGERAVIDMDSDNELPLYTPRYLNNVLQPDHGYRPAARRCRTTGAGTRRRIERRSTRPPEAA